MRRLLQEVFTRHVQLQTKVERLEEQSQDTISTSRASGPSWIKADIHLGNGAVWGQVDPEAGCFCAHTRLMQCHLNLGYIPVWDHRASCGSLDGCCTFGYVQGAQEDVAAVMHHSGCLADAQLQITLTTAEQQKGSVQASAVIAATPEAAWLQQVSHCLGGHGCFVCLADAVRQLAAQ